MKKFEQNKEKDVEAVDTQSFSIPFIAPNFLSWGDGRHSW
jgi:hypothetical protein